MCDELTDADNKRFLSRRQFAAGAGAAGVALTLPRAADAAPVAGRDVMVKTPDGEAQAYFVAPASGKHPAVLIWPDIYGLRPAFEAMGKRLAESGYAVLVVNQFYRTTRTPFNDRPDARDAAMEWRKGLTPEAVTRDAGAFVKWLDAQPQVDTRHGMATTGYCMGGPFAFRTAALRPERVRALASFHGAALVTDTPDSPHLLVPKLKADALIAIAQNDDERAPTDKDKLRAAFAAVKRPAEIEVYPAQHGWCPPDSKVYDQAQAERAWARQFALFKKTL